MKKVIVFTSFGVADAKTRAKCLDTAAFEIARSFPKFAMVQAYTSDIIREKMIRQGFRALSLPECLEELLDSGCEEAYIQPSHLTPGEEYDNKIVAVAAKYRSRFKCLAVGEPLFFTDNDYNDVVAALLESLSRNDNEEIVLVGHGSPNRHNPVYEKLQKCADALELPLHVGVVEKSDTPNFDDVLARLKKKSAKDVLLVPLLMVGGVHVTEDMVGDSADSWSSRLKAEGFNLRADTKGLGEYPAFRAIYIKKTGRLITSS